MTELALGFNDALDLMEPRGDFITLPLVSRSPLLNIEGRPSRRRPRGGKKEGGREAGSEGGAVDRANQAMPAKGYRFLL